MNAPDLSCDLLPTADGRLLAVATLDSERSLNALTLSMVDGLLSALAEWSADPRVVAVLLRGRGDRAFCAGGDVRRLTEAARAGRQDASDAAAFFAREYRLDHVIHHYAKPVIVWGSGVVMGGGMGLFIGASHRVVTDSSRLAMPEITIGLYPDVGGSHFLSRLPGRLGLFLGLTGVTFGAADALHLGLGTQVLPADGWEALLAGLQAADWSADAHEQVTSVLAAQALPALPTGPLQQQVEAIEALMSPPDLPALDAVWRAATPEDAWLKKALAGYCKGSPTSAALIWRQWETSRTRSLADVFRTEWVLSVQCVLHADFPEGVRALLVDKDLAPRWSPATLAEVDAAHIEAHYALPAGMTHPLLDLVD